MTGDLIPQTPVEALKNLITRLVLPTLRSPATRRVYNIALRDLIDFMVSDDRQFNRTTVMDFIAEKRGRRISSSGINQALAAIKKLAYEARYAPSGALPEEIYRGIEDIRSERSEGRRTGNWLTIAQVDQLLNSVPLDLTGRRDRALLATLIGCALRRDELLKLKQHQIVQREGRWVFADVFGKGSKYRTVPIPAGVKARLDDWIVFATDRAGYLVTSPLFVPIIRGGRRVNADKPLSESAIAYIVRTRALAAGLGNIAPHDLRRSYAKIARTNKSDLDQIQVVLGHENVATTQKYVGGNQNLQQSPADLFETDWGGSTK